MRYKNAILTATFFAVACSLLLLACGKDKYTTKPQLKFIKAENYEVAFGDLIEFEIEFTDKEGDLSDSIYIQKLVPRCPASDITVGYLVPAFPSSKDQKGRFDITFVNGKFLDGYVALPGPQCQRNDTATFRFWIKDKEKNVSDTITTDKPLVIQIP